MDKFEQVIENAALQEIGGPIDEFNCIEHDERLIYGCFKKGAKSDAAKAFHQQGMYTEEEVLNLLSNNLEVNMDWVNNKLKGKKCERPVFSVWFEQNKKK